MSRGAMFVLGYIGAVLVSVVAMVAALECNMYFFHGMESAAGLSVGVMTLHAVAMGLLGSIVLLVLSLPVAWFPFFLFLALASRLRIPLVASALLAGIVTSALLVLWNLAMMAKIFPFANEGQPAPSIWAAALRLYPFVIPAGALGGAAFWSICRHRGDKLPATTTAE